MNRSVMSPTRLKSRSLVNDMTDPPGSKDCSVELCLDTSVSHSQSSSPEIKSHLNGDEEADESKDSPLVGSEDSDYKLDDDKNTYEETPSSLASHDLDLDGGIGVSHDVGFVSSTGNFAHETDEVSQLSAKRNSEDADDDWVRIDSLSPQRTINQSPVDSRLASQSSPIHESHVSLCITSPDVENLALSPHASSFRRRFSSSNTLGDFTNYPTSGSFHAYYGSDSSYDGNEDQNFQHKSHSRKNKHPWQYVNGCTMRLDKEHGSSELPFANKTRCPSSFLHNSLPPRPNSRPSHDSLCSEPDKIDLMRTVNELKAQLKGMQLPKNNLNDSGTYHIRREQAINWGEPCQAHIRRSCLHCCPQEHHYSAQLPSHFVHHCKNGHCMVQTRHSCCNVYSSLSSLHHESSGHVSLRGCETTADHHKHQENEIKRLLLEEKHHNTPKKHLLPLAGGAPFVTCYYCSELLQLPTDSIIFNRRYHWLTCSSCKKVLKLSLLKGTKIARHLPHVYVPPTSEAGDYSNAKIVSRSDDHGLSFVRSCSADYSVGEDTSSQIRKIPSGSCNEAVEDRKMKSISRDSENKNEVMLEAVGSFRSSFKVPRYRKTTSGIEERVKSSNSPLHRLMGYSSPRQVLNN